MKSRSKHSIIETIKRFRDASTQGDEELCTDLYQQIKNETDPVADRVEASMRTAEVADFRDEKLQQIMNNLENIKGDTNAAFKSYYRTALTKQACDVLRKKKKLRLQSLEQAHNMEDQAPQISNTNPEERSGKNEKLAAYTRRKRELIDALELKPLQRKAHLLIDQRQRMTDMLLRRHQEHSEQHYTDYIADAEFKKDCEQYESWQINEPELLLQNNEPAIGDIWQSYAHLVKNQPDFRNQDAMVASIRQEGHEIAKATWRQRVSRYLRDVADQLDEEEFTYFLTRKS